MRNTEHFKAGVSPKGKRQALIEFQPQWPTAGNGAVGRTAPGTPLNGTRWTMASEPSQERNERAGSLPLGDTQTRPCPRLCAQAHTGDSWFLAGTQGAGQLRGYIRRVFMPSVCNLTSA